MGKDTNNPKTITINDVEYDATTFTDEQVILTNHCLDLDRKIGKHELPTYSSYKWVRILS
jgi:hypothetical protein